MLPVTETLITQRSVVQIHPHSRIVGEYSAYTDQAIDQGYRAVQELLIELTPKNCRDASSNEGLVGIAYSISLSERPNEL